MLLPFLNNLGYACRLGEMGEKHGYRVARMSTSTLDPQAYERRDVRSEGMEHDDFVEDLSIKTETLTRYYCHGKLVRILYVI